MHDCRLAIPNPALPLSMLGLTYRDAAVGVRERARLNATQLELVLADLRATGQLEGLVYLATCNRVELYWSGPGVEEVVAQLREVLEANLTPAECAELDWATRTGDAALLHLFRVAASLDSLVLGDTEILAQVRRAYESARQAGQTSKLLNLAFQWALKAGKGVRTHTSIQQRAASVASLVAQELRALPNTGAIVVLGAGEIAQAVIRNLKKAGPELVVLNRSEESLARLAQDHRFTGGRLTDFIQHIDRASALVSCLAVETPLLDAPTLAAATWGRPKPLRVYDLGVPRNIDPGARHLPGVILKDMDDLQTIVEANRAGRAAAAAEGEAWVAAQAAEFALMWSLQPLAPVLEAVRGRKDAPPAELGALLAPHLAQLSGAARLQLARQLGPATARLPQELQLALLSPL